MTRKAHGVVRKLSLLLMLTLMTSAFTLNAAGNDGNALLPDIPRGKGESCVADTDFMRRNHMDLLDHQRDETVIEGLRENPYRLKDCIDCHAVMGPDAAALTADNPNHFCRACHDYAAVSIDCFQCHASRPGADEYAGLTGPGGSANITGGGQ